MSQAGEHILTENARVVQSGNYKLVELVSPSPAPTIDDCSGLLATSDDREDDSEAQIIIKAPYQNFRTRRKRHCCRSLRKFVAYLTILSLIAVPVLLLGIKSLGPCSYNTILSFNRSDVVPFLSTRNISVTEYSNETNFQVTLFGDSLLNRPFLNLDLDGKIKSYLPQFTLDITNVASSGCKISDMRGKLEEVLEDKPDAIILYWDSDVSDVDESKMTEEEVVDLRSKYKEDLSFILSQLVSNITFVAVAGPGILGNSNFCVFLYYPFCRAAFLLNILIVELFF